MTEPRPLVPTQVRLMHHSPSSFPPPASRAHPAPLYWTGHPQASLDRSGNYISPDPSPTSPQHEATGYPLPPFGFRAADGFRRASEPGHMVRHPGLFHPTRGQIAHRGGSSSRGTKGKGKQTKKVEGKQPTFLTRLYSYVFSPSNGYADGS